MSKKENYPADVFIEDLISKVKEKLDIKTPTKNFSRILEEVREVLKEDILDRYDNIEHWDQELAENLVFDIINNEGR
jgi:hypothetical protein